MQIKTVENKRELYEFIDLPWKIYKEHPHWVPPLKKEIEFTLNPQKNPFWKHAERELFIVKKEGKIVGRIAAIVDQNHNNFHHEKMGFFGFFECIPDYQVAEMLLGRARQWLKEKSMQAMRGPVNPSMNEKCGFLLEGFDKDPVILMPYNPSYYIEYIEKAGFKKAKDLFTYFHQRNDPKQRVLKLLERIKRRKFIIRNADMKNFRREVNTIKEIYNSAWSQNWGFVPITDEEADLMANKLKPLVNPELVLYVEIDGEPAGFSLSLPDYNQVLKHLNGKLGFIGLIKFLYSKNKINMYRLMAMGVKKEYRNLGIELLLSYALLEKSRKVSMDGELGWTLEDNDLINKASEEMGGILYKKYRIYEISLP